MARVGTPAEIEAFNSGVLTVLKLAEHSAAAMDKITVLKPTRFNFAAEALRGLAEEGLALLKRPDGSSEAETVETGPKPLRGGPELIVPAHPGDDGNFGLADEEIMRPSRQTIINWLSGKTPMLASHWSKIAARMLQDDATGPILKDGPKLAY